jgi:hypothetical protein
MKELKLKIKQLCLLRAIILVEKGHNPYIHKGEEMGYVILIKLIVHDH